MIQKFDTIQDAIELAKFAHRKQVDKAGLPYIEHPLRVLEKVRAQGGLPYVQAAAVLHDVSEDTSFTPQMLLDLGVSEATVEVVKLLDRGYSSEIYRNCGDHQQYMINGQMKDIYYPDGPNYMTKDEYYYACIKANPAALMVKLADIEDNLSPWRQAYLAPDTQERLKAKYAKALDILTN